MAFIWTDQMELGMLRGRFCAHHKQYPERPDGVICINCFAVAMQEAMKQAVAAKVKTEVEGMSIREDLKVEQQVTTALKDVLSKAEKENAALRTKLETVEKDLKALGDRVAAAITEHPMTKELEEYRIRFLRLQVATTELAAHIMEFHNRVLGEVK